MIRREPLTSQLAAELAPLMAENHAAADTGAPLAPDLWLLQAMQPLLWIVRVDGRAVGYCAHFVQPHPFFGERWASCAAIYLRPEHRGMTRRLVAQIEAELQRDGVRLVSYSVPHLSRAGSFFEAIGYDCRELVMAKRIDALPA